MVDVAIMDMFGDRKAALELAVVAEIQNIVVEVDNSVVVKSIAIQWWVDIQGEGNRVLDKHMDKKM